MHSQQHKIEMTEADEDNDDGGFGAQMSSRYPTRQTAQSYGSSGVPREIAPPTNSTIKRIQLGNKDLIIRMLAEIFQVRQDENGLVRWQQISTSLVPISLYSRTTSRWLDYLLTASAPIQTDDSTNAMSPDSRDFLLLLQHFHQQTRPTMRLNTTLDSSQNNEYIVFQVVGHDYLNGQCKKILNVKLKQPGTRLGQASDYFVYWREQSKSANQKLSNLHNQQFSASSFVSSTSTMPPTLRTAQMLNQPATNQSRHISRTIAPDTQQTWGLNFASINDAKLFYDICSLNLVDLDFNSEYLKQLAAIDTRDQQPSTSSHKIPMATNAPYHMSSSEFTHQTNQQQRRFNQQHQQNMLMGRYQANKQDTISAQTQCKSTLRGQSSLSRCPSCRQTFDLNKKEALILSRNPCPVHGDEPMNAIRMRSRSTTRQPSTVTKESEASIRARSFSTPASPDHDECPVHRRRHRADTESEHEHKGGYLHAKQNLTEQLCHNAKDVQSLAPQKPARGLMRSLTRNSQESSSMIQTKALTSNLLECNQYLHTKEGRRSRYVGHIQDASQLTRDQRRCPDARSNYNKNLEVHQKGRRQLQHNSPSERSPQSTQVVADKFEIMSRRDARMARARYANSKNMKEFLSLDAGGVQAAPMQQRFQSQQTRQQQQDLNGGNIKLSIETEKSSNAGNIELESMVQRLRKQASDKKKSEQGTKQSIRMSDNEQQNLSAIGDDRGHVTTSARSGPIQSTSVQDPDNSIRCNVSTTTDDLPMDKITRRRMLKLTSDEVISERTEPKSISTSTAVDQVHESGSKFVMGQRSPRDEKTDRQVRAVSLGPELGIDSKCRNRSARSDAGRRKSLERSTCVDLDSSMPMGSFVKYPRLSPLPQSLTSPLCADACPSDRESLSCPINLPASKNTDAVKTSTLQHDDRSSAKEGSRRKSKHEFDGVCLYQNQFIDLEEGVLSDGTDLKLVHGARELLNGYGRQDSMDRQLSTFKSAPDVRCPILARDDEMTTLMSECRNRNREPAYNLDREFHRENVLCEQSSEAIAGQVEGSHFINVPRLPYGRSNLSSYAVPLCSTVKRSPQKISVARQYQSCPSSLRRKRRSPAPLIDHYALALNCPQKVPCCSCGQSGYHAGKNCAQNIQRMHSKCDCCGGQTVDSIALAHSGCHNCDSIYSNNVLGHNQYCHSQHLHYSHHDRMHHLHHCNQPRDDNPYQHQAFQSFCSQSSQSNRSPMHYGLYESDCEDDAKNETNSGQNYCDQDSFSRSHSAYFRPSVLKPVQGYDQTMARVSLKSRQRSRSQPPNNSCEANNNFHLTKSMENVEKLIKEVQNELRALKRQPLGTARIDMASSIQAQSNHEMKLGMGVRRGEEMSLEENQNTTREQNSGTNFSYTSATRRAGQFKCVGAIRKAGFLSVKKWILKRRLSIELARKQGWKRYWVCLRGTALLFHSVIDDRSDRHQNDEEVENLTDLFTWIQMNCLNELDLIANLLQTENSQENTTREEFIENISKVYIEKEPRHLIIIDGSIAQPIPEHPRRDFVFCLSTTFGDAYLFQASCQLESDNWISAIHNACAASIARDLTRDDAIKLFETKIRQFEVEADKKVFLRQRLESRLTSMASMCHVNKTNFTDSGRQADCEEDAQHKNKLTMRLLLYQLNQQLLALDTYTEQLQCEIYQLRCYLSSCGAQNMFYQSIRKGDSSINQSTTITNDLPHPKSLLMHVSKPTKLLLIKLGIFTVSSLHAYIHARQDSSKLILNQIQQSSSSSRDNCLASSPLELRIRSHSISETLMSKTENVKLQDETEDLLELANIKTVSVQMNKSLVRKIMHQEDDERLRLLIDNGTESSDDRYSIHDLGQNINFSIKLNPKSNSMFIIKQILKVLEPNTPELEFLNYYLRLVTDPAISSKKTSFCTIKRKETLKDWSNYKYIELLEKIVFRIELDRGRSDENTSAPFGVSVEGQLFSTKSETLLNVYCSYIEWGSVADKAGLQDDDEFLSINGVPVNDLDLMFVECIIQDANKLRVITRSSRQECPPKAVHLNSLTWQPLGGDGDPSGRDTYKQNLHWYGDPAYGPTSSQVISDEYLGTLVCPPPPSKSDAFLRTDTNILRQKSDLGMHRVSRSNVQTDASSVNYSTSSLKKSKSQHRMNSSIKIESGMNPIDIQINETWAHETAYSRNGTDLARQLLLRSERLTKLLAKGSKSTVEPDKLSLSINLSSSSSKSDQNNNERLQKSILELIETEYAYIRHLETIIEHYMSPLEDTGFLNISDLKSFNDIVLDLLTVQHRFFDQLTLNIAQDCQLDMDESIDQYDRLNRIIQKIDALKNAEDLKPVLESIARIFLSEADKFKIYSSYCAAYSRLQKILHSKNPNGSTNLQSSSITLIPTSLNTFSSSVTSNCIGGLSFSSQTRELKLISLANLSATNSDQNAQLKRLTDFLGNIDSSSSSASLSLAKSSDSNITKSQKTSKDLTNGGTTPPATNDLVASANYKKSVNQQNFESYLIKPIQRIVKYPMLLNSISLMAQSYASEPFYQNLLSAIKQMESIVNHVNDTQRVHDEYGSVFDHIERQYFDQQSTDPNKTTVATLFGPHQPPINLNIAQLLYFGSVDWLNMSDFGSKVKRSMDFNSVLFVFNSCVVFICKERIKNSKKKLSTKSAEPTSNQNQVVASSVTSRVCPWSTNSNNDQSTEIIRYQTLIPVGEVQVRSAPSDQQSLALPLKGDFKSLKTSFQWELFQCSSSNSNSGLLTKSITKRGNSAQSGKNDTGKVYLLANRSNEERTTFLRKIRFIIRESVRNMSLPLVRSPSSKSLTSKKLSTSSATSAISNTNINSSCSQAASLSPPPDIHIDSQRRRNEPETHVKQQHAASEMKGGIEVIS